MTRLMVLTLLLGSPLMAQTGAADGTIRGTILDPSGGAVLGASVTARNLETGFERGATSGQAGDYEVPLLPPGRYELKISAKGFATFDQTGILVQLSKASSLDVRLVLA